MAQNQNIPRRLWKIETTHRGVATHSLRTTALDGGLFKPFTIAVQRSDKIMPKPLSRI